MTTLSFADLQSPDQLRQLLVERGLHAADAPADQLFALAPEQQLLLRGARIVAVADPAPATNTLVVLWLPRATLPQEVLRTMRRELERTTRDALVVCAASWQQATLYLLVQEQVRQGDQAEQPVPVWGGVNFAALRPADRQALALLDLRGVDHHLLGQRLGWAFRRARRPTPYQNQGLFSNYFLQQRLGGDTSALSVAWQRLGDTMPALQAVVAETLKGGAAGLDLAATRSLLGPLLAALGWTAAGTAGQLELRSGGAAVALCQVLPWDTSLDGALQAPDGGVAPALQLIGRLTAQTAVLWGILTNGRTWRLIGRQATSTSGVFYEVDLADLQAIGADDAADLRWLAAFFGAQWLAAPAGQPALLSEVYQSGQFWAEQLGGDLKTAIFRDVFVDLANALAEGARRAALMPEPTTETLFRATLVLLYRLLFVLYAESRRLLPLTSPAYYVHSLTFALSTLALQQQGLVRATVFSLDTADPRLWQHLQALFRAVADGNAAWHVPHYNGGLFAATTSSAHQLLADLDAVANDYLASGLDRLARDADARQATTENEALRLIDYMDLDVRRLGSIYEGLLEFQLRRADSAGEVVNGQLQAASATRGRKPGGRLVAAGEVYLTTTRQDRKASGSYYTPDYIVRYIVEQTVGPVLAQRATQFHAHLARVRTITTSLRRTQDAGTIAGLRAQLSDANTAAVDALLDLKVLDPAMGSGHFLVAAVNFLSDQIIAIIKDAPDNPLLPQLAAVRTAIRANLAAQGIPASAVPDEQLSDQVLLRRMVMKRCIYGVDLNDMAVELAKLSLWLELVRRRRAAVVPRPSSALGQFAGRHLGG